MFSIEIAISIKFYDWQTSHFYLFGLSYKDWQPNL